MCNDPCAEKEGPTGNLWICLTCHSHLSRGSMPPEAQANNLELEPVPIQLKDFNSLEQHLVALTIPFSKIVSLPRGGQPGVKGPCVCVPSDVTVTTKVLPRPLSESDIIAVKLKRKLEYQGHVDYKMVNIRKLQTGLSYLQENNPLYADIEIDENWNTTNEDEPLNQLVQNDEGNQEGHDERSENDEEMEDYINNFNLGDIEDEIHEQNTDEQRQADDTEELDDEPNERDHLRGVGNDTCLQERHDERSENDEEMEDYVNNFNLGDIEDEIHEQNTDEQRQADDTEELDDEPNERDHLRGVGNDTCLQPIDMITEALAELRNGIFSVAPAEGNTPVSLFRQDDKDREAMSFPTLFPHAKNTFKEDREKKLTLSKYFNSRLLSADLRFAQTPSYVFFAQYAKELDQLLSGISISMRKGSTKTTDGREITADMLGDNEEVTNIIKSDIGFHHFDSLRGSPDYWKRTMNDLFAMIRQLGLPTWFATFSCAELSRWPEIIETIERQKGNEVDFSTLTWAEKCEILRSNPVTAVRMFDQRVKEFLTTVIKSPANPIGKVVDHFIRLEFQQRGAPHIHCLFWVENAPIFGETDDASVLEFIDRYISCKLPDENEDPELYEIVKAVQTHRKNHSQTCNKGPKECRFDFPQVIALETFISRPDDPADEITDETEPQADVIDKEKAKALLKQLSESLKNPTDENATIDELIQNAGFENYEQFQSALSKLATKSSIVMQRDLKDVWINGYNADLLRSWNGNMDLKYILEPYSCVMYILSYISKSEHELGEILKTAQQEMRKDNCTPDLKDQMKKLGTVYFENREVSIQESIVRTCSIKLKDSSRQVTFVSTDNNARMSKPLAQIQANKKTNTGDDIWMTSLEDRYKARPQTPEFDIMSQAQFASEYRVLSKSEAEKAANKPTVHALQNNKGYIMKRTRGNNAVIRFAKFSRTNNSEKYYESLLKLYLPFRLTSHLKPEPYETYENFHEAGAVKLTRTTQICHVKTIVEENRQKFDKGSDALQEAWQQLQDNGPLEDAWSLVSPETEMSRREALAERDPNENTDALPSEQIPELQQQTNKEPARTLISVEWLGDSMKPLLRSMNQKQKEVYFFVRDWCLKMSQNQKPEPFFLHVTGGAGTGKSHLIKCIYYEASKILKNLENPEEVKVLLTAPTGTAAFNIGGFTVHSALKIPRTATFMYQPLGNDGLNTLRSQLAGLQILIVDEISMVDLKVLAHIHGRLKQIKQIRTTDRSSLFGGVCILAVGDFYQLPPVKAKSVCLPNMQLGSDMWNDNFEIVKLEEITFSQSMYTVFSKKILDVQK